MKKFQKSIVGYSVISAKSKFMIFFKHPKVLPRLNLIIAGNTIEQVAEL